MHIPREIRKKLEASLPSYVLEFLTEKFIEAEKYCEKSKELEKEVGMLKSMVYQKDEALMNMYQQGSSNQQRSTMGYSPYLGQQKGEQPSSHYYPFEHEEWDYPHDRRGSYMRRGVPGSKYRYEARRGSRNDAGGGSSGGGNSGGGNSGGGGGSAGGATSEHNPDPEIVPMYTEVFE